MTERDPIQKALRLPGGARFFRAALQVNPHHYSETYRGQTSTLDERTYVDQILSKCHQLDIQVLGVTDHNHVGAVDLFRERAGEHGVWVFPGFEISSSEGVHVLCVYSPSTEKSTLERYLGEFGIRDVTPSAGLANKPFTDVLSCVRDQGGVCIAAHATQQNGLLTVLQGQSRIHAWKDKNLLAVQIPGPVNDAPADKRAILRNQESQYKREPGAAPDLAIAVVNAKDIARPEDLEDPSATCWIKMSDISIDGLRQAFFDPMSRIRLHTDPAAEPHVELVAIAWQSGFLGGQALHLNENLNVLIGGRGSGKSTVIESIRYALGLAPVGDDAQRAHQGIVQHVLRSGTKLSLLVRSHHPVRREYRIERTVPNPPIVRDEQGQVLNVTPTDVLPRTEVYGQHEIAELTQSKEKLTSLLARFVEADPEIARRKSELRHELQRSRLQVLEIDKEIQQIDERLAALPALEETLKTFEEAGLETRLKEQSLLVREERLLETAADRLSPYRELLIQLRHELAVDVAFLSPRAIDDLPGKEFLLQAASVLERLRTEVGALADQMAGALTRAEQGMTGIHGRWTERKRAVQAAYEAILRELQKSKVDGEEFIRLRRRIEELRPLTDRLAILRRDLAAQQQRRRDLLAEWEDTKSAEFRQLERAATNVTRKLSNRVSVEVSFEGEREPLCALLRTRVGGRLAEAADALRKRDSLSLKELAEAIRSGRQALHERFAIPLAQADRLAGATADIVMEIEELELPSITEIRLNVAAEGQPPVWKRLDDLSKGQKATAILLLLLLESDAPLIVDQPEDDLDNRFITESVVPKMREEKGRRQFLFATHNANIPVLGDAELIAALSAAGEASQGHAEIPVVYMGSIDERRVRELVEEILEGGKEAFEIRRLKYGF